MSGVTNFSAALSTWKDINLAELQKKLDDQGVEIVDNQKEGLLGRKALADKTKEFKKLKEEEKLNAFKGLLKAYQTEIDNITKRCKTSDNAFLNVYKILAEAPDPYPLLEAAVDQAVKVTEALEQESELKRLRDENAEMKKRISDFSSVESAKKKLELKVEQMESKMDDLIQEKVAQKANELNATYDERIRNYEEREQDLQKQITLSNQQLRDMRASNETHQAKLFDQTQKADQEVFSKLAEVDMIIADLDRANKRIATVERRNEILRAEIETLRAGNETSEKVQSLESQIADLESESSRLSRSLEAQKALVSEAETRSSKRLKELSDDVARRDTEIQSLKTKLERMSDYDEIKRELAIVKYVEFSGMGGLDGDEQDEWEEGESEMLSLPSPNAAKAGAQKNRSLEALLASKNKRIQEELTKFRILHNELQEQLKSVESRLESTSSELEKQKELNERLENDLLNVHQDSFEPFSSSSRSANGSAPQQYKTASEEADELLADLDNIGRRAPLERRPSEKDVAGINGKGRASTSGREEEGSARSTPIPFSSSSADTSILPIVTSQRDRFRQRNAELEEELRKQYQIISDLRAEIKSLQADNLKLYEKVRYMQSYQQDSSSRASVGHSEHAGLPSSSAYPMSRSSSSGMVAGDVEDGMGKYHSRYEESVNPFEVFRGREQTRAYQSLNPLERTVLLLTRPLMGSRRARTLFVLYAIALHGMLMYTSWTCSPTTALQKQSNPYSS